MIIIILIKSYKDNLNLLIGLFYYSAYHYAASSLILFFHLWNYNSCLFEQNNCQHISFYKSTVVLHSKGMGNLIGIFGFFIFFMTTLLISFKVLKTKFEIKFLKINQYNYINYYILCSLLICSIIFFELIASFYNLFKHHSFINILTDYKEKINYILGMFLVLVSYIALNGKLSKKLFEFKIKYLIIILLIPLIIGLVEVTSGLTYSFTANIGGSTVFRATSTFFNPNIYALWIASIYFILSFACWLKFFKQNFLYLAMFLSVFSIYITGSRSVFLSIVTALFFITFMLPNNKNKFIPLLIFITSFFTIYFVSSFIEYLSFGIIDLSSILLDPNSTRNFGKAGVSSLVNLGNRFIMSPIDSIIYFLLMFISQYSCLEYWLNINFESVMIFLKTFINSETTLSLDLRFNSNKLNTKAGDNGWIQFIRSFGIFITIIFVVQYFITIFQAIKLYLIKRNIRSSCVIGIQIFCLMISFNLPFFIFPIIIIISILQLISILFLSYETKVSKKLRSEYQ